MQWSIQNKMVIVFSSVVFIMILVSLTTYRNAYRLIDANRSVVHIHEVQQELEEILSLLKDAETGQRGFLLTGDEQYLEPYRSATASLTGMIKHVEQQVADYPAQLQQIRKLQILVSGKMTELEQTIQVRRESGLAAAQAIVQVGKGKEIMDRIRTIIKGMRETENGLLRAQIAKVQKENNTSTATLIVSTLLNLLLMAIGYYAITRYLHVRKQLELQVDQLTRRLQQQSDRPEALDSISHENSSVNSGLWKS